MRTQVRQVAAWIRFALVGGFVALLLAAGPAYGEELQTLQRSYRTAVDKRERAVEKMRTLEERYNTLVSKIDRLKSKGADELSDRFEVKELLRRSQRLTDRLESLDRRIDDLDGHIETLRSKLVSRIGETITSAERRLVDATPDKRRMLVDRLNELRKLQETYETPLPEAPDAGEITQAMKMARTIEGHRPDRMAAAAAELEDTEAQIRKRLKAVEQKLSDLEQAQTLARRAETFQSEESFFDEANRPHVVGRHETEGSSSDSDGDGGENSPSAPSSPESRSSDDQSNDRDPTVSEPASGSGAGTGGGGSESSDRETSAGGANAAPPAGFQRGDSAKTAPDNGATSPEAGDTVAAPTDRPAAARPAPSRSNSGASTEGGGSNSGAEGPETSVVFEREADLSTAVESDDDEVEESTLDARIDKLEAERERLREQAERLEQKAKQLKQRADELDSYE